MQPIWFLNTDKLIFIIKFKYSILMLYNNNLTLIYYEHHLLKKQSQ